MLMNARKSWHANVQIANAKTHGEVMNAVAEATYFTFMNTTLVLVSIIKFTTTYAPKTSTHSRHTAELMNFFSTDFSCS